VLGSSLAESWDYRASDLNILRQRVLCQLFDGLDWAYSLCVVSLLGGATLHVACGVLRRGELTGLQDLERIAAEQVRVAIQIRHYVKL
jgi:hypothetical protein